MDKGTLYLIPTGLCADNFCGLFPEVNLSVISSLSFFIVEELKTARRFISKACKPSGMDQIDFVVINEHSRESDYEEAIDPLIRGKDVGLLSEAGLPCIADPGSRVVSLAHRHHIRVIPLSGPGSVFLALMASGFNGQNFTFHGYLPVSQNARELRIRELERFAWKLDQTQIFMETPYRNNQLIRSILSTCRPDTLLCVACNLTGKEESIISQPISSWKNHPFDYHKKPAVFLIYKGS